MIGIVIVSHSRTVAEGVKELALVLSKAGQPIFTAGGGDNDEVGISRRKISEAITAAAQGSGVLIIVDFGSAAMHAEAVIKSMNLKIPIRIANAPILEGAVAASVQAACGAGLAEVLDAAEDAGTIDKLIMSKVFCSED